MLRWTSFADLLFADCAWLAFARAAELAETDVHEQFHGAWLIDDRRIQLSLDHVESGRSVVEGMKRFLGLLALQAVEGETRITIAHPPESWVRCPASSVASPARAEKLISGVGERTLRSTTVRAQPLESGVAGGDPIERIERFFASRG